MLRDGGQVLLRPERSEDRPELQALFERISPESRQFRLHSAGVHVEGPVLDQITSGHALVAELSGTIVGLTSYYLLRDPKRAEMAILVDDAEQRRGIGTVLFERLSADAWREGIQRFVALVLAENRDMIDLLQGLGFGMARRFDHGVLEFEIDLRPDPAYIARHDARMHVAAVASLDPIFHPRAIAVIGASHQPGTIGHELFRNLLSGGFAGAVFPVNPAAHTVASVLAYRKVSEIPDPVDLAIVAVPAASVLSVAQACLDAGVRGLIVISAGFAEAGEAGRRLQDELLHLCRSHGARLVGPNCMGILVSDADGSMNATFAPVIPPLGRVAFSSQSGALGIAVLEHARRLGLGISSFVSVGNKADVSSNDLLERWEEDPDVDVILLYLESFGNPRRFSRIARRVGTRKPLLAVKGGRSQSGRRAAASHTAALAGSEVAVDALFRQAGVMRCDTLEELLEATVLFVNQPLPAGNRVGILTNAGGLGILCADACEANGLTLPSLSDEVQAALRTLLPAAASISNPVDMLASAPAAHYGGALRLLLGDPALDSVIVLFIPPLVTEAADVAASLLAACTPPPSKPVLTCFLGVQGIPESLQGATAIPSFTYPESAARALGHAVARAAWLRRPAGRVPDLPGIDADGARAVVAQALKRGAETWLQTQETQALLRAYGVMMPESIHVHSAAEAAEACGRLGAPVAVKLLSSRVVHKSDVGGVQLGLNSPAAAAAAYGAIAEAVKAAGPADGMDGALVQRMVSDGTECLVGVVVDPTFGPLIGFGLGGTAVELLGDVAFRLQPLTDIDAEELINSTKASQLLQGYRGGRPADRGALRDLLLRISQLVEDLPEIVELDINPVMVRPAGEGLSALDARVRITGTP